MSGDVIDARVEFAARNQMVRDQARMDKMTQIVPEPEMNDAMDWYVRQAQGLRFLGIVGLDTRYVDYAAPPRNLGRARAGVDREQANNVVRNLFGKR